MKRPFKQLIAATALAASAITAQASSHREALAILNEPCADNTDTYAWVAPGTHDKLYLIMDFNPLHEPGQGNQGLRACNGYRYQFHIALGKSLEDAGRHALDCMNRATLPLPEERGSGCRSLPTGGRRPNVVGQRRQAKAVSSGCVSKRCSLDSFAGCPDSRVSGFTNCRREWRMKRLLMWAVGVPFLVISMVMVSFSDGLSTQVASLSWTQRH